jgi:AcrR family transcriptional regulator
LFKKKMNAVQELQMEGLMAGKRAEKREDLKARLIAAARRRIEATGLASLRARDVTADAGCALGALYTVFDDLDALILEVGSMTLNDLEISVHEKMAAVAESGARMQMLGAAYLAFARDHPRLWRALFEHQWPEGRALPDWFMERQIALLRLIAEPLGELQPNLPPQELMVRARTLFASVHGIVSISLENRFVGIPTETLDQELHRFIGLLLAGIRERREP